MPVPSGKSSRSLFDTFRMLTGSQQYGGSSLGVSFYGATFAALRQECGVNRKHWSRFIRLDHYELQRREAARRAARKAAAAAASGGAVGAAAAVPSAVGARDAAGDGSAIEAGEGSSSSAATSPRKPPLMRAFTSRFGAGGGGTGGAAAAAAGAGGAAKDDGSAAALPPLDAESGAEIDKQWEELRGRLHAACYDALSARVRLHETELRRLYEQRYVVGWNYAPYFCLTESLAFVFAQIRLPQEALRCYDEVAQVFDLCSSVPERLTAQLSFAERLAEVCGASLTGFASGSGAAAASSGGPSTPVSPGRGGSLYGGFGGGSGGSYGRRTGAAGGSATAAISGISRSTALVIFGASPSLQEMLQALRTVSGLSDRPMLAPYPLALLQSLQQQEGSRPGVFARSPSGYVPAAGLGGAAGSRQAAPGAGAGGAGSAGLLPGGAAGAAVSLQPHLFDLTQQPYRQLIYTSQASLFDFRHYLFARQCQLLQMLRREHEIAARAVPFIKVCARGHCGARNA
jgi:hypothetical protein